MVSVCMATYNGDKYIRAQLESILSQLKAGDELVISDDSSNDGTIGIIQSFSDARIRLYSGNTFRDPIRNFQHCLQQARGDYIFLADQDDIWMDQKYAKMLGLLSEYDLVVSDSIVVDENLQEIEPSFFRFFGSGKGIVKNIIRSSYYGSCMAFRQSLLKEALPFPATKEIGHDLWLGLVAEITGKVLFYKEPLLLYRRHSSAFTHTGLGASKRNITAKIRGRLVMLSEIIHFLKTRKWRKD
jgi:glycosyltransferase involved in cell wall biosynthesis